MNRRLEQITEQMEPGLERAVSRALEKRVGHDMAIRRGDLVQMVRAQGHGGKLALDTLDRQVRLAIVDLRRQGFLICSSSGDGGYYLAASRAEYEEFIEREYGAKIRDMAQTKSAMDQAARAQFGEGTQLQLL